MKIAQKVLRFSTICLFSLFIMGCAEDPTPRERVGPDYFRIDTYPPAVDESGATFNANVIYFEGSDALGHGFLWGKNPEPDFSEFFVASFYSNIMIPIEGNLRNTFSARVTTDLKPGDVYHVRNYVITEIDTIMGNIVPFVSKGSAHPIIDSVEPNLAKSDDTILIKGKNFPLNNRVIRVRFDNRLASYLFFSGNSTQLFVRVPSNLSKGEVELSLEVYGKKAVYEGFTILED